MSESISRRIEDLDDQGYESLLLPVWRYLALETKPQAADVVFVFGGLGLEIPSRAAELYLAGFAPLVLISGSAGLLTEGVFSKPEAQVFRDVMVDMAVPAGVILTENRAENTGQNVSLGMETLKNAGLQILTVLLVSKSFIMRRCVATFNKQYPDILALPCPPCGSLLEYVDRPRDEFARRLLGELARLQTYGDQGFIVKSDIPTEVVHSANQIRKVLGD